MAARKNNEKTATKSSTKAAETKTSTSKVAEAPKVAETEKAVETKETKKTASTAKTSRAAKATSSAKKAPARRKAPEKTVTHFFEVGDRQINTEDVTNRVQEAFKNEGHQVGRIKKLEVYYNFEENRAYYVINDKAEGKYIDL